MARIVTLYPVVTVRCEQIPGQEWSATPGTELGTYVSTVEIPVNTTDDIIVYEFEAWAKEGEAAPKATGVFAYVTQAYTEIIEYNQVLGLVANPDMIGPEGGLVVITAGFVEADDDDDDGEEPEPTDP
jgi:hypothetical protein